MQALWTQTEASYAGAFIRFGRSWASPKPVQQPRMPLLLGAAGTDNTFAWIARSADGWLTTPGEKDIERKITSLKREWQQAGRPGTPQVAGLASRSDHHLLARWEQASVTEVLFGMPDRGEDEVNAYLRRLAAELGLPAR